MKRSNTNDLQQTVTAESNLQDVASIVASMHRNKEPLLHAAVYIELLAYDLEQLKLLQTEVLTELIRSKLNVDRLMLRQQQGFICVMPSGWNVFGDQFERVLPASSVANLYPFNYSGKTDANGFYLGRDKFGSNILVDFNKRADDKTNANILILGNSGQGKSYLLKLILCNMRQSGMHILALDPEMEYEELTNNLGGCFIDLMSGEYIINVLEPKTWDENGDPRDAEAPQAFRQTSKLSQHISFLKDFFRTYKDFDDRQIDTIEIMLGKLYDKWGITDRSNFDRLKPADYPILSDLYELVEAEYKAFDESRRQLYTADTLREICLGLHSLCKGAESNFFNGHTNITSGSFVTCRHVQFFSLFQKAKNNACVASTKPSSMEGQCRPAYPFATNNSKATIAAILSNSPSRKFTGYEAPGRLATNLKRRANRKFGSAQTTPPNKAEITPRTPAKIPAPTAAIIVAPTCRNMTLNMGKIESQFGASKKSTIRPQKP